MQDREIVALFEKRDETALRETQTKYDLYLTKIANNILSDAEDSQESVNDTYLAAWNSIPPHKPENLSTYLGKLVRRIAIDCYRKKNRAKRQDSQYALSLEELGDCVSGGESPESALDVKMLSQAISRFLRTQSPDVRSLFIGRYYYLDSLRDVANYCNITESKAKTVLFRTRRNLKEFLIKEGFQL